MIKFGMLKKKYTDDNDVFLNNTSNCLGYTISVYQESINKEFDEYLVNFDYFTNLMKDYGFVLESEINYNNLLINSIDSFKNLHKNISNLSNSEKKNFKWINNLTKEEKEISFLNNYFIFKKVNDIVVDVYKDEDDVNTNYVIDKAVKLDKNIILTPR